MKTSMRRDLLARFAHALSDPTRTDVLLALIPGPGYPTEIAEQLGATRQTVSNHLTHLRSCGLVVVFREGRRNRYELADPRFEQLVDDVAYLMLTVGPLATPRVNEAGRTVAE